MREFHGQLTFNWFVVKDNSSGKFGHIFCVITCPRSLGACIHN